MKYIERESGEGTFLHKNALFLGPIVYKTDQKNLYICAYLLVKN